MTIQTHTNDLIKFNVNLNLWLKTIKVMYDVQPNRFVALKKLFLGVIEKDSWITHWLKIILEYHENRYL